MSNTTRDYRKDFDYRSYTHTASASQFDTFLTCPRKWWFSKVARLPEVEVQLKYEFGERLHEACERWLAADDQGRDTDTGEPVELWPDGWDLNLEPAEGALVRRLVEKGIEEGVLRRTPGRAIEAPIGTPGEFGKLVPRMVVPGVGVAGYRDLKAPGLVEDHKSIKSKNYRKSQKAIQKDPQMMLYAAIDLIERKAAGEVFDEDAVVTLRQNQFVKDPKDLSVRGCEIDVPMAEISAFWDEQIEPAAQDMLRYKQGSRQPGQWPTVEKARAADACRKYGGCPFQRICGKIETTEVYKARIDRINETPVEDEADTFKPDTQENRMGVFDRLNKPDAPAAPVSVDPDPTTVETLVEEVEDTAVELPADTPPWTNAECTACKGTGFNSKGKPCLACDRNALAVGLPRTSAYTMGVDDEGYVTWTRTADGMYLGRALLAVAEVKSKDATKPPKPKRAPRRRSKTAEALDEIQAAKDAVEEPTATTARPSDVEPDKKTTTAKRSPPKSPGRSATGWLMVYGSVRRAKMQLIDLNEVFFRYAAELAKAKGVDSYYRLDRFKRKDDLAAKAAEIAKTIPSSTLVVVRPDLSPDLRAFAAALEPFAGNVVEGMSQ